MTPTLSRVSTLRPLGDAIGKLFSSPQILWKTPEGEEIILCEYGERSESGKEETTEVFVDTRRTGRFLV